MKLISAMAPGTAGQVALDARKKVSDRRLTDAKQELSKDPPEKKQLRRCQATLEREVQALTQMYDEVIKSRMSRDDVTEEALEALFEDQSRFLGSLSDCITDIEGKLGTAPECKPQVLQSARSLLPTLKLEPFDGNPSNFPSFIDNFEASVDSRDDIHAVDKLNVLRSHLRGPAYTAIKRFRPTADNYASVLKTLKDRFGSKQRYELSLVKEFFELKTPSHNLEQLSEFHGEYENLIQCMGTAGCDIENDWTIVRGLMSKLNRKTWMTMKTTCNLETFKLSEFRKGFNKMLEELQELPPDDEPQSKESKLKREKGGKAYSSSSNRQTVQQKGKSWKKADVGNYSVNVKGETSKPVVTVSQNSSSAAHSQSPKKVSICLLCGDNHHHFHCSNYPTVEDRLRRAVEVGRCRKCFRIHDNKGCTIILQTCWKCKQDRHHALFCPGTMEKTSTRNETKAAPVILAVDSGGNEAENGAVPTATATVCGGDLCTETRIFLDLGAQRTFIHSRLVDKLCIKPTESIELTLDSFTETCPKRSFDVVTVTVIMGNIRKEVRAVVMDKLPDEIPVVGLSRVVEYMKEKGLKMADPSIKGDILNNIGILMGSDYSLEFIRQVVTVDNIHLLETSAGHALVGRLPKEIAQPQTSVSSVLVANINVKHSPILSNDGPSDLEKFVPQLWELESIGIQQESYTPEEASAYAAYHKSVEYHDNQYWVKLPWKVDRGYLPTNYHLARHRLLSTLKKLEKNPKHIEVYSDIIREQEQKGFIEKVENAHVTESTHYLPHLAVIKESKTTPIRIVFDCSAKQDRKSNSLNDCLYSGPSLTEKLGKVLLKFRTNPYAFAADISKAFLRVGLQEDDRDFTRFLWPKDPLDPQSSLVTYRFRSVLFGATSSPFLLQATLTHHLDKSESPYAEKIKDSLYVDNVQGTIRSEEELLDFYSSVNQTMAEANMPLQSWTTNSTRLQGVMEIEQSETEKLLGLTWNIKRDALNILEVNFESDPLTKRKLLSSLSRIFDPLGLLSPLTIPARVLMQETWKHQLDWDSILPETIQEQWSKIARGLKGLSQISFPREACREGEVYDLHVFCDASQKAYGAVAYVTNGVQTPQIVMSKAKVAPVQTKTLPQLELTALYIGVKLQKYIRETLVNIQFRDVYLWSDSEVALCQVKNNNSKKIYVRNRVAAINEMGSHCIFRHVRTEENPADLLTRGQSVAKMKEANHWFYGPLWLNHKDDWPIHKGTPTIQCPAVEIRRQEPVPVLDGNKYSSLKKLLGVTKRVFTFINMCKKEERIRDSPLSYWLKLVQETEYAEEVYFLKEKTGKVPELVKKLGLFLENDIIRCKGRIDNSQLSYSARFPILLPKKHWFTKLVIEDAHHQALHGGVQDTLCKLREHYWVPQGRQSVKSVIGKCYVCRRLEGPRCDYPAPPALPSFRVDNCTPFLTTGVDYTGALNITDSDTGEARKVYVVLFTCANTRAVHLELAIDLTADTFLNVFRRFVARRSCPQLMISDNGRNFQLSSSVLRQIMGDTVIQKELEERGCRWKFIAPRSPWQGGFYERLIGVVKSCLKKVLFKRKVSIEDLYTLVAEIENRVNNRPLTYISDDIDELEALTPSHLICGRRLKTVPLVTQAADESDPSYLDHRELNVRYTNLSKILNKWQDVWKREYLTSLREKFYGVAPPRNLNRSLKVGDVVVVQGLGPRAEWPLGRVEETCPDEKGAVRLVKVRTKTGTSFRTVEKLYPLECEVDPEVPQADSEASGSTPQEPDEGLGPRSAPQEQEERERPSRRAATKFRDRLRSLIDSGDLL